MDGSGHWAAGSEKVTDAASGNFDLRRSDFRAHGQRDDLPADALRFREAGILEREVAVFPHGLGPVDQRLDSLFSQVQSELVAMLGADHIILIAVEILVAREMG